MSVFGKKKACMNESYHTIDKEERGNVSISYKINLCV